MQRDDFNPALPVSRGQWQNIAERLIQLAGEPVPRSRLEATELLVRLAAGDTPEPPAEADTSDPRGPDALLAHHDGLTRAARAATVHPPVDGR